mgnify:CR=1 FL=1
MTTKVNTLTCDYTDFFLANVTVNHNVHTFTIIVHGYLFHSFLINVLNYNVHCFTLSLTYRKKGNSELFMGEKLISKAESLSDNDIVYVNAKGTTRWNRVISQFFPFSSFLNSVDNLIDD